MKDDSVYLRHILDAIHKIEEYIAVGKDVFMAQTHWQDAVIRQLEIIGEATKHLSDELRKKYQHVPWRRIAGLRDRLIHDYMNVNINAVWVVTQNELSEFKLQVEEILSWY